MNKLTGQVRPRQRLRIAMWHLDGGGNQSSSTSNTLLNSASAGSHLSNNANNRILVRRFDIQDRLPYISKILTSFAPSIDALIVLGGGSSITDPSSICDTDSVYDYVCHGTSGTSFGNSFVFVPKKSNNINNSSVWTVEPLLGVGGLHVRMKLLEKKKNSSKNDSKTQKKKNGEDEEAAESEIADAFSEVAGNEVDADNESTKTLVKRSGSNFSKEYFMDCCFLDLDGVDRSENGSRGHQQINTLGTNSVPSILPVNKDLTINCTLPPFKVKYTNDTNEFRLARYFTNIAKKTDLLGGHLKNFQFDFDATRKEDESEEGILKASSPWKDAWTMAGKNQSHQITFDAPLCAKHYYDIDTFLVKAKSSASAEQNQDQRLKDFMKKFSGKIKEESIKPIK